MQASRQMIMHPIISLRLTVSIFGFFEYFFRTFIKVGIVYLIRNDQIILIMRNSFIFGP